MKIVISVSRQFFVSLRPTRREQEGRERKPKTPFNAYRIKMKKPYTQICANRFLFLALKTSIPEIPLSVRQSSEKFSLSLFFYVKIENCFRHKQFSFLFSGIFVCDKNLLFMPKGKLLINLNSFRRPWLIFSLWIHILFSLKKKIIGKLFPHLAFILIFHFRVVSIFTRKTPKDRFFSWKIIIKWHIKGKM